jgi:hypothetical protein
MTMVTMDSYQFYLINNEVDENKILTEFGKRGGNRNVRFTEIQ